jgi:two-component system, cell cycle sensor histidine kinase and response regulator CckA
VVVRTRNQDIGTPIQDGHVRLASGHYVCVEFEDSGCGMAPDVLPRVFEPFFTTKKSPQHRGLGLAWVYGIVTNHGGSVAISSHVGRGTTVRIYLPAQKKIVRDRAFQTDDLRGTETILMIDDEELLLTMGEMVLSSFGYRVLTANSGPRAIEIFSQHQSEIGLVITDLVMPKMSGRELIAQLRLLSPAVKIICSSGYVRALNAEEEEMYLQKPFTSLDLLRKVRQALASSDVS